MKHHYLIIYDVKQVHGTEIWEVDAENETAARVLHEQGKSKFVDQKVEVTSLGEPEIILDD